MKSMTRWLIAIWTLVTLTFVSGGMWLYYDLMHYLRQEAERELQAISRAKVGQIIAWRAERLGDASVLSADPFFAERAARWLADSQTEPPEAIRLQLRSLRKSYDYDDFSLTDARGNVRVTLRGRLDPLHPDDARCMAEAFRIRKPVLTDLHLGNAGQMRHLGVIAPLFAGNDRTSAAIGALILQCDARQFLNPLIQSWPTANATAETLLVRREGDSVLFLNEVRHQQPDGAFHVQIPLNRHDDPGVMAALGREGVVPGRDYRGVEVLSALRAVPDSPWFLIAKIDLAEALAVLRRESILGLLVLVGCVALSATALGAFWQWNQKTHFRALFLAEHDRHRIEERYRTTLRSVGEGVIATDADGRVEFLNPAAEALTGWTEQEGSAKPLLEVFNLVSEDMRQPVENFVHRAVRGGSEIELRNQALLVARNGVERSITASGTPIRGANGEICGAVLVFRDQTREHALLKRMQESVIDYQNLFRNMLSGCAVHDLLLDELGCPMDYRFVSVNPAFERQTGLKADDILGRRVLEILPATERFWIETYGRVALTGESISFEQYHQELGKHFEVHAFRPQPGRFAVTFHDITKRRQAEDELVQRVRELQARNDELERFHRVTTGRELRMIELKREINELCRQSGLPVRYAELTVP